MKAASRERLYLFILFTITPDTVPCAGIILNTVYNIRFFSLSFFKVVMCGKRSKAQEQMKTLLLYKENRKMSRAQELVSNVCAIILFRAAFEIFLALTFLPVYQSS